MSSQTPCQEFIVNLFLSFLYRYRWKSLMSEFHLGEMKFPLEGGGVTVR